MHFKPWFESWPVGLAGSFDGGRAKENADYLIEKLGPWITKHPAGAKPHLLQQTWQQSGPDPYLSLNRLAEDLRTVEHVQGLPLLLRDLKMPKRFEPTLHEIHTAALFQRGGHPVSKFYNPLNDSAPDFDIDVGQRAPVEAKQLMPSGASRLFSTRAFQIQSDLSESLQREAPEFPEVEVVVAVKEPNSLPPSEDVRAVIRSGIDRLVAGAIYRSPQFNVVAQPLPPSSFMDRRLTLHIVSPTDPKEDERVEGLIKKANRQLRENAKEQSPGIACIALRDLQDPEAVAALIKRKFADAQFRSVSGVLLHRYASFRAPERTSIADALEWIPNQRAHVPITSTIYLKGPELTGPLVDLPKDGTVSCYCIASAHGRVKEVNATEGFGLTPIYRVQPDLLK